MMNFVFLETNQYFTTTYAINQLLKNASYSLTLNFALRCAHVRKYMAECLQQIALIGIYTLTAADIGFLFNRGYSSLLLETDYGSHLFRSLPAWQRLEIILLEMVPNTNNISIIPSSSSSKNTQLTSNKLKVIEQLIRYEDLDAIRLIQLIKFLDPGILHRGIIWAQKIKRY